MVRIFMDQTLLMQKNSSYCPNKYTVNPRASLVGHVWWHKALFHFQLGEFEQAITTFDDVILPSCQKEPGPFTLSDATSLLMRLQCEPKPIGIDLKDRWREVGKMYQNIVEDTATMYIFYDFHALLGCLYGDERYSNLGCQVSNAGIQF